MLKNIFFIAFSILIFRILSISTISSANANMVGRENILQMDFIEEKDLLTQPLITPIAKPVLKYDLIKTPAGTKGFKISIPYTVIDYGELSPTNPVIRDGLIMLTNLSGLPFSIFTLTDHPLVNPQAETIPDTSCDNGACTKDTASAWTSTLTFGFGYRCENLKFSICFHEFTGENYFKQFPSISDKEDYVPFIYQAGNAEQNEAKLIFKVNTSASQQPGSYINTVTFLALPGY